MQGVMQGVHSHVTGILGAAGRDAELAEEELVQPESADWCGRSVSDGDACSEAVAALPMLWDIPLTQKSHSFSFVINCSNT